MNRGPLSGFPFGRNGEPKTDPVGEYVRLDRDGRTYLGEVLSTYRDEDETLRARCRHFNREPWPIDPPVGCLLWIKQGAE